MSFPELHQDPFRMKPDLRFLYLTKQHSQALAYVTSPRILTDGNVLLTGEIGSGKTLILERFVADLERTCVTARIFQTQLNVTQFLQTLLTELGQNSFKKGKAELLCQLKELVPKVYGQNRSIAIVIDEAQNLRPDVLEEIRLLSEIATGTDRNLTMILAGQPELADTFKSAKLVQLAERTPLHVHLNPLDSKEVGLYIKHRLTVAGKKEGELFDVEGIALIHRLSGGIPRRINILCQTAMLCAYGDDQRQISVEHIDSAAEELKWHENYVSPSHRAARRKIQIDTDRIQALEMKLQGLQENYEKDQRGHVRSIEQRDSKITEQESELKFRIGLVDKLADNVRTLQNANIELRDLLRNRDSSIGRLTDSEDQALALLNDKKRAMQDLKQSLKGAEDRYDALKSTLKNRDLTISHLEEDLAAAKNQLDHSEKKRRQVSRLSQDVQYDRDTTISSLERQVASGMETISTLRNDVTRWSEDYLKLQLRLEDSQALVSQLKNQLSKAGSRNTPPDSGNRPAKKPRLVSMRGRVESSEGIMNEGPTSKAPHFSVMANENNKWVERCTLNEYLTIGHSDDNNLTLKSDFVSPFHALITTTPDGKNPCIEDLDSMNGTFVNGKRIKRMSIMQGDEITIGKFRLKMKRIDTTQPGQGRDRATCDRTITAP